MGLQQWELREEDEEEFATSHEPPVPAGLDDLTGSQRALADSLRLDADLLAAAAAGATAAGTGEDDARRTAAELLDTAYQLRATRRKATGTRL